MKSAALKPPSCMYPPIESPTTPPLQTNASLRPSRAPPVGHSAHRPTPPDRLSTHRHQDAHSHRQRHYTQSTAAEDSHTACCADTEGRARSADAGRREGRRADHGERRADTGPRETALQSPASLGSRSSARRAQQRHSTNKVAKPSTAGKGRCLGCGERPRGRHGAPRAGRGCLRSSVGGRLLCTALSADAGRLRRPSSHRGTSRGTACRRLCWAAGVDSALVHYWKTE
jgi:hypothetical protein